MFKETQITSFVLTQSTRMHYIFVLWPYLIAVQAPKAPLLRYCSVVYIWQGKILIVIALNYFSLRMAVCVDSYTSEEFMIRVTNMFIFFGNLFCPLFFRFYYRFFLRRCIFWLRLSLHCCIVSLSKNHSNYHTFWHLAFNSSFSILIRCLLYSFS